MIYKKELKGSYTVELAAIMPVIILILILSITMSLFLYDKCILEGIAMETAVAAAEALRYEDTELSSLQKKGEFVAGKRLIYLEEGKILLSEEKDRVTVSLGAGKEIRGIRCNVHASASTIVPEKYIRLCRTVSENQKE